MYEASCRCTGFSIGLYDYQACSVGLKMDVYMHRRQESRSQSTVNRSTEFKVTTSLRRNIVCTSVIVGYGVKMKRRLCVSVQCAGCYFFSPKLTKMSSIRDRLLQGGVEKICTNSHKKRKGPGRKRQCPALCEVCLRPSNPALLPAFSYQSPSNDCPCACFARFRLSDGCPGSFQARPVT